MLTDKYIHSKVEDKIYAYWETNKLFKLIENKTAQLFQKNKIPTKSL